MMKTATTTEQPRMSYLTSARTQNVQKSKLDQKKITSNRIEDRSAAVHRFFCFTFKLCVLFVHSIYIPKIAVVWLR